MKKFVIAFAIGFMMMSQSAFAGMGYWSPSGCSPPPPVPVQWWGFSTGAYYYSQYGFYVVDGDFHRKWSDRNWECGKAFGIPWGDRFDLSLVNPLYLPGEWLIQDFMYGRMQKNRNGDFYRCPYDGSSCTSIGR